MFCEKCGTKLPDVARYCENCGVAVSYAKGISSGSDGAILRESPVTDERKTINSTATGVWLLAILVAIGTVVFLFMQKWIGLSETVASSLVAEPSALEGVGLFETYKFFKSMAPYLSSYDATGGFAVAEIIITALAAVNLICVVNAGIGALMLLIKKNKAARGFAITSLVFYTLLTAAVFGVVYYVNKESGMDYSVELLKVDMMAYIGFIPMIANVVLSHMNCKKD